MIDRDAEVDGWLLAAGDQVAVPAHALGEATVTVLASQRGGQIEAGAIAHRSGSVVGVSNVFGDAAADPTTWGAVAAVLADVFPGLALVGYEAGERLQAAREAGFDELGPLRVWFEPTSAVA